MKNLQVCGVFRAFLKAILSGCIAALLLLSTAYGQEVYPDQKAITTPVNTYIRGYYEWLPPDYNPSDDKKYPLLIFIHGIGELGDGGAELSKLLSNGPPRLIRDKKMPTSFTVNGEKLSFIVISPQFKVNIKNSGLMDSFIELMRKNYKVDADRIYLTGLSMGGGLSWFYSAAKKEYSEKLAALAIVCGNMDATTTGVTNIASANLPVKIFHNQGDPTVPVSNSQNWYNGLNGYLPAMTPKPQLTVFNASGHDAWSKGYSPDYKENGLNVFEWMLSHKRGESPASKPAANLSPVANAGQDISITLPVSFITLSGAASDPDGSVASTSWKMISGPSTPGITLPLGLGGLVTGLLQGTYVFEFTVTDNLGATSKDTITVTVNPLVSILQCKANAGPDQTIIRGESSSAVLDGSASQGTNLSYSWRLMSTVSHKWISNLKNDKKAKADAIILPYLEGGYKYELTVSNGLGCVSKDTTIVKVDWGKMPPQSSEGKGWHVATAADLASIPTAKAGDIIIDGANTTGITGGKIDISISSTANISLKGGQKILIKGGRYKMVRLNFTPGTVNGTKDNPVIITNYGGQVECMAMTISNVIGAKLTGKYVAGISGDPSFRGHEGDKYAFSRGKYGFFSNSAWGSLGSSGLRVMGTVTDSLEIEYMEIGNGHFTGMMIKEDNGTKDFNDFNIHDVYIHDIHGEGVYFGSTGGDPQHQLNNWRFTNNRIVNAGNEIFQFNNVGYGSIVRNNVFINSATNRRSTFSNYQDNGVQFGFRSGNQKFTNNIMLGNGHNSFNAFIGSKSGIPTDNDTIYVMNNLVKYGAGNIGGYFTSSNAVASAVVKMDSNYFGGFEFTADQIFTGTRAVNTNTLIKIGNSLPVLFRNNVSDGSKSLLTAGGKTTLLNNRIQSVSSPNFVNSGWPLDFDFTKLTTWADYIFNTWKDEFANQTGVKLNAPVYHNAGDYVIFLSKTYRSKVSGNLGHVPRGVSDEYWELVTWKNGEETSFFPPDDYRLKEGDEYKKRNIGLTNEIPKEENPNQPPVPNAGADITITLPVSKVELTGSAEDADGTIATWKWAKISGPTGFVIVAPGSAKTEINGLTEGTYFFELTVIDNAGASGKDTVKVTVNKAIENKPPVADAGSEISITLPVNSVQLSGKGTSENGTIVSYSWAKIAGPSSFTIVNAQSPSTAVNDLVAGMYEFELTVKDDKGAAAKSAVKVYVGQPPVVPNVLPIANAGSAKSITLPVTSVTLSGSGTDSDGSIISYNWKKTSGPSSFSIVSSSSATTLVNNLVEGVYEFELTVTDDDGATARAAVKITVNAAIPVPNKAPIANAGSAKSITLPVTSVTLSGSGTDSDGSIISYNWKKTSGPSSFSIVSSSSATTLVNNLVEGVYEFELTVTDDDGATARAAVKITVNAAIPVPNKAPIANAGSAKSITLPVTSVTLSGSGTDSDGSIISYNWKKTSGPSSFSIVSSSSATTLVNNLVEGVYEFELTVTDDDGATAKAVVKITVNPAPNKAPVANAGSDIVVTLPHGVLVLDGSKSYDSDGSIRTYSWVKISGPSPFSILNANTATPSLPTLLKGVYTIRLVVTDDKGAQGTDDIVIDVKEVAPPQNKKPLAIVPDRLEVQLPAAEAVLDGSGSYDADGRIVSYSWSQVSGDILLQLSYPNAARAVVKSPVPGEYYFKLTVKDDKGDTSSAILFMVVKNSNHRYATMAVSAYPNPVKSGATIMVSCETDATNEKLNITVFDITGRPVVKKNVEKTGYTHTERVPTAGLTKGAYMVEIFIGTNGRYVRKIIVD